MRAAQLQSFGIQHILEREDYEVKLLLFNCKSGYPNVRSIGYIGLRLLRTVIAELAG
jgi:hypothetical protein